MKPPEFISSTSTQSSKFIGKAAVMMLSNSGLNNNNYNNNNSYYNDSFNNNNNNNNGNKNNNNNKSYGIYTNNNNNNLHGHNNNSNKHNKSSDPPANIILDSGARTINFTKDELPGPWDSATKLNRKELESKPSFALERLQMMTLTSVIITSIIVIIIIIIILSFERIVYLLFLVLTMFSFLFLINF